MIIAFTLITLGIFLLGFCARQFFHLTADGGPDIEQCLEIMDTCLIALKQLDVGDTASMIFLPNRTRDQLEATMATAAERIQMALTHVTIRHIPT